MSPNIGLFIFFIDWTYTFRQMTDKNYNCWVADCNMRENPKNVATEISTSGF